MNPRREAFVGPVVPRRHRPELLDSRKEARGLVPPLVHLTAAAPGRRAVPLRGNDRHRATSRHLFEQPVGAIDEILEERVVSNRDRRGRGASGRR